MTSEFPSSFKPIILRNVDFHSDSCLKNSKYNHTSPLDLPFTYIWAEAGLWDFLKEPNENSMI